MGLICAGPAWAQAVAIEVCPPEGPSVSPPAGVVEYYSVPGVVPSSTVLAPAPGPVVSYFLDPGYVPYVAPVVVTPGPPIAPAPAPTAAQLGTPAGARPAEQAASSGAEQRNYLAPRRGATSGPGSRSQASETSGAGQAVTPPPPLAGKGRQLGVIEGMVVSGTGVAEEGVAIRIRSRGPKSVEKTTTTDSLGRFAVSVPHGEWAVYVTDRDGKQRLVRTIAVDPNQIHHLPIYR